MIKIYCIELTIFGLQQCIKVLQQCGVLRYTPLAKCSSDYIDYSTEVPASIETGSMCYSTTDVP